MEIAKDKYEAKLRNGEMGFINPPHAKQGGQKYEEVWNKVYLIIVSGCLLYKHLRNMIYKGCINLHIDRTVYHFITSKSSYLIILSSSYPETWAKKDFHSASSNTEIYCNALIFLLLYVICMSSLCVFVYIHTY